MKTVCLNIQDCGYQKTLDSKDINQNHLDAPFNSCPLCGFYTVTISKDTNIDINIETYLKILDKLRPD
tara:strand:+ start:334 stop:537 length:204 start_codon:yes stop_codon:yes gene_type:complete